MGIFDIGVVPGGSIDWHICSPISRVWDNGFVGKMIRCVGWFPLESPSLVMTWRICCPVVHGRLDVGPSRCPTRPDQRSGPCVLPDGPSVEVRLIRRPNAGHRWNASNYNSLSSPDERERKKTQANTQNQTTSFLLVIARSPVCAGRISPRSLRTATSCSRSFRDLAKAVHRSDPSHFQIQPFE